MRLKFIIRIMIIAVNHLCLGLQCSHGSVPITIIDSADYGAVGDGVHDDGPAIAAMVKKAIDARGSVTLRFESHSSYFVKTAAGRYVFPFNDLSDVTVDGGGSIFLLDGDLRFIKLSKDRNTRITNLSIDYVPLPFADGKVIAKNPQEQFIDVEVSPGFDLPPLGGPTHQDGEQLYFGMLWYHEDGRLLSKHYVISDVKEAYPGSLEKRVVRAYTSKEFSSFDSIVPGQWEISLPVRGVAHRYGPGATIEISQCEDVIFQNVEVCSAPWFAINASNNHGKLTFRHTYIRPKAGRLTSSWRDGFHIKGNSGSLLWEDCEVTGTNDDAFNIATHSLRVLDAPSPSKVSIRQVYGGGYIPPRIGDTLVAVDLRTGRLLGKSKVKTVEETITTQPGGTPPTIMVTLDPPLEKISPGDYVWDAETANPDTLLRRCTINASCRFQSAVHLEDCDIRGLVWCYAEPMEGPVPATSTLRNCDLRRGRGNPTLALSVDGHSPSWETRKPAARDETTLPFALGSLRIEGCRIDGDVAVTHVEDIQLWNNVFGANDRLSIEHVARQSLKDNRIPSDHVSITQSAEGR